MIGRTNEGTRGGHRDCRVCGKKFPSDKERKIHGEKEHSY